jgi:tetratricopeptide (TPR) repeat protein
MKKMLVIGIAVVVGIAGWYLGRNGSGSVSEEPESGTEFVKIEEGSPVPPQVTPSAEDEPIPLNLVKPVTITANLTKESRVNALKRIEELRAELRENDDLYSNWMALALQMKLVGEYRAAEEIWQYAAERWFVESTPYGNLANLYLYELPNPGKAEEYFLKAIERQPRLVNGYYSAYEFYRYVRKDLEKARQILERGRAAIPEEHPFFDEYLATF